MKNINSSDGIAEDIIRSFTQLATIEMHYKTLLDKRFSEIENGIIDNEDAEKIVEHTNKIQELENSLETVSDIRRSQMLRLYQLFGKKGDKERWCTVKHYAIAGMTAFEAYQASDNDNDLLTTYIEINKLFIRELAAFLGVEITDCAACFADILKAEVKGG